MVGLHDGYTGGQRLEHREPLRFAVDGGHREDLDPVEQAQLPGPVDLSVPAHPMGEAPVLEAGLLQADVLAVLGRGVAGDAEADVLRAGALGQEAERFHQQV